MFKAPASLNQQNAFQASTNKIGEEFPAVFQQFHAVFTVLRVL